MVEQVESQQPPEEELPIDIDYAKFLDWLVDRRRIPRNWHVQLKSARALVRVAIAATPQPAQNAHGLEALPSHYNLHYYRVLDIRDALAAPDAPPEWNAGPDKDMIGRWKSPVVRAWSDAVAAFQNKAVYLADSAQVLVRNADIEAVALKASIAKLHADVTEFVRREAPAIRSAADAKERFVQACHEFDMVDGQNVDFEVQLRAAVSKRVPEMLTEAVRLAKEDAFVRAFEYYEQFARYVCTDGAQNDVLCPTARDVMEGDVDELTRERTAEVVEEGADVASGDIDWGAMVSLGEVPGGTEASSSSARTEIDWGIEIDSSGAAAVEAVAENEATGDVGGIKWDDGSEVTIERTGEDGGKLETDSITLADASTREMYLTDLLEIEAFLSQRVCELSMSGNSEVGLILQQVSKAPDCVKGVGMEEAKEMLGGVEAAIGGINSAETRRILGLQSNGKLLERVARSVLEKKHVAERMHGGIDVVRQRGAKAASDVGKESAKFEELSEVSKDVKRRSEEALSKLYKGRIVNILGEINNVFPS